MMTDTWQYRTEHDPDGDLPEEWIWERLRNRRDQLLTVCDFRVLPDVPWDTAPWLAYRQALRDLPEQTADPRKVIWPTPPQ